VIYLGVDDTDMPGTLGTNKFARALAERLAEHYDCALIVRHQLLLDPRVPYTSKNSSASLMLQPKNGAGVERLIGELRSFIGEWFIEGSDPGFSITEEIPEEVTAYGKRCQREVIKQEEARDLAAKHGIHLEGCGGTNDGVIGSLAAIGLIADGNDGRVVKIGDWPDDLDGVQDVETVQDRGVEIQCAETAEQVTTGKVDVGKHLRPNRRHGRIVLYAQPPIDGCREADCWRAVRFT